MKSQSGKPMDPNLSPKAFALVDLGGTLVDPSEGFLLERFVRDVKLGIDTKRKILLDRFSEWQRLSGIATDLDPNSQLEDVGVLYAETMEGVGADELQGKAEEWFKANAERTLLPYSLDLIEAIREFKLDPVLISTSPVELIRPFADYFSISEIQGLHLAKGPEDRFTGLVENRVGMNLVKDQVAQKFTDEKRSVAFAIGNSSKDSPSIMSAINNHGQAVLINPSARTENEAKSWFGRYLNSGQLHIIDQNTPPSEVIRRLRHILEAVLESIA